MFCCLAASTARALLCMGGMGGGVGGWVIQWEGGGYNQIYLVVYVLQSSYVMSP